MKTYYQHLTLTSLLLFLFLGCDKQELTVNAEELDNRGGVIYIKGTDELFTGKSLTYLGNGQLIAEANIKNGKLHGRFNSWHTNGQKESELDWKNGQYIKQSTKKLWNSRGERVNTFEETKLPSDFANLYGAVKLKVERDNSRSIIISQHPLRSFNGLYEIQEGIINNRPWYKNENDRFLFHYNQAEGGEKSWSLDHRKPDGTKDIFSGGWTKFNNSQIPDTGLNDWYSIDDALYGVVWNGIIDDVKLFIEDGAKINHQTPPAEFGNMSILDIAIAEKYTEIAEILRQNGAKTSKELSAEKE